MSILTIICGEDSFQHLSNSKRSPVKTSKILHSSDCFGFWAIFIQKDFIYRDGKLENVLMDDYGNVSLTDFEWPEL